MYVDILKSSSPALDEHLLCIAKLELPTEMLVIFEEKHWLFLMYSLPLSLVALAACRSLQH
jgi:hypothetical protein